MTGHTALTVFTRKLVVAAFVAIFAVIQLPARAEAETFDVDVVGLRLGMTAEEARAALSAHDSRLALQETNTNVTIQDSYSKQLTVATYLSHIAARSIPNQRGYGPDDPEEVIAVRFAPPPAEHRVSHVHRYIKYKSGNAPALDAMRTALVDKYGQPNNAADDTLVTQIWVDGIRGALAQPRFMQWQVRSGISDTSYAKIMATGSELENNRSLGVRIVPYGHEVRWMNTILTESVATRQGWDQDTSRMANEALVEHEAKLKDEAAKRQGPKL